MTRILALTGAYYGLAGALLAAADAGGGAPAPKAAAPAPKASAPAAAAPVEVDGFKLEAGLSIPAAVRIGTKSSGPSFPFDKMQIGQSFLVPVQIADTIKDDAERAKAFKEAARKQSNRVSGAIRRYKKSNEGVDFAIRTVNDDTLGHGVRVWRVDAAAA